jgi:hypothetical protein
MKANMNYMKPTILVLGIAALSGCVAVPVDPYYSGGAPGYYNPAPAYYLRLASMRRQRITVHPPITVRLSVSASLAVGVAVAIAEAGGMAAAGAGAAESDRSD